jgi:hypothetical protein
MQSLDCDGNDPNNPLDWKYGGVVKVDPVKYSIVPQKDQGYTHGKCSFHLQQDESWSGVDGPGTKRTFTYHIEKDTMKDGSGNVIGTLGFARNGKDGAQVEAGDANPLKFNTTLPDPLIIIPEAAGNPRDYIQFEYRDQSWTTNDHTGVPSCTTGDWTSHWSPAVSSFVLLNFWEKLTHGLEP